MKRTLNFLLYLLVPHIMFAASFQFENGAGTVEEFAAENGLEIFVKSDDSMALVHSEFVVNAGFSAQTPSTAGFFPLYADLFRTSVSQDKQKFLEMCGFTSECKSDSVVFSASVPAESFEDYVSILAECVTSQNFSDDDIKREFSRKKSETKEYASSTAGFINSSIDSRIFASEPWKHDSGIYPNLFSSITPQEARSVLYSIGRNFYTPDNSAFFVAGNISADQVYLLCAKEFSGWKKQKQKAQQAAVQNGDIPSQARNFVLVSKDFSKELSQIVIQYLTLNDSEADILASSFNRRNSAFKKSVCENSVAAVRSEDYVTSASAQKSSASRFIVQALMEEPYAFSKKNFDESKTPFDQVQEILSAIRECSELTRRDFIAAQNEISEKYRVETGNSESSSTLLADTWALWKNQQNGERSAENFFSYFVNIGHKVQHQKESQIAAKIRSEVPYTFLLLNDEVFEKCRINFEENGFETITEKNGSWWKNEMLRNLAESEKKQNAKKTQAEEELSKLLGDDNAKPSDKFYYKNSQEIKRRTLSNGIPIVTKENRGSQTAAICVAINYGLIHCDKEEKNLSSILANAVARNSGIPGIEVETKENFSFLTAEVKNENATAVLSALASAIIYGDVSPVMADRIVGDVNYKNFSQNGLLGTQLKNSALGYLYRNSPMKNAYDFSSKGKITFDSIEIGYTKMLDASLYHLVVAGDVDSDKIYDAAEKTFGLLKEQSQRDDIEIYDPQFKSKERNVQLSHLYKSDIPAELAPKEVPVLVPTKNFYDPCQIYIKAPSDYSERAVFNSLLAELCDRIQKELGENFKCTYMQATEEIRAGYIQADNLKRTSAFVNAFKSCAKKMLDELCDDEKNSEASKKIRGRWVSKNMAGTSSNSGTRDLLAAGAIFGNPHQYLEEYVTVENTDPETFSEFARVYFVESQIFVVRSSDSKR